MAQIPALSEILRRALSSTASAAVSELGEITGATTLDEVDLLLELAEQEVERVLAEAAIIAARDRLGLESRTERNGLSFLVADGKTPEELIYTQNSSVAWGLDPKLVHQGILNANHTIAIVHDLSTVNDVPIFRLLGLRNLSSFVGEIFVRELYKLNRERLMPNPHQDGYPDLCALTPEGKAFVEEKRGIKQMSVKEHWSPFPFGGVEIKATCGNTPKAEVAAKLQIGESRLATLQSAEWKAHHRDTNKLIGLYWDFLCGLPTILAAFYRNDLTPADWGKIVQPKEGGGKTTSVSIMTKVGVKKMGLGWIVLPTSEEMRKPLCQKRVFDISEENVKKVCSQLNK